MDVYGIMAMPGDQMHPIFPRRKHLEEGPTEATGSVALEIFSAHLNKAWRNPII